MARVADTPEKFDVIVTENLYGDIVSDVACEVAGSIGLAGSMNLGEGCAMFEAVHGSAPDIAGQGKANPSGLLNAAVLMLYHIGQGEIAAKIGNALLYTLENGQHTGDIATDKSKALSTSQFGQAVIANLGKSTKTLKPFATGSGKAVKMPSAKATTQSKRTKALVGVDVFIDADTVDAQVLGAKINQASVPALKLNLLSSRGMAMFDPNNPSKKPETDAVTDLWACRFMGENLSQNDVRQVLANLEGLGIEWVKTENLYTFDGVAGFSGRHGA
jgi:isocitrate dehydrogenase